MRRRVLALLLVVLGLVAIAHAGLSTDFDKALRNSTYIYVQSERKSGELGKAAEIWFFYDGSVVYVGTRPTSFRVRRIKAKRTRARIAVGTATGLAFDATGAIVNDPAIAEKLMAEYAKKYPEGWKRFETSFRDGFKTGERVLVSYTPK